MARNKRIPDAPEQDGEPEATPEQIANADPNAGYDGASRIYADRSGKPHGKEGSEGGSNFAQVTREAHATVAAAIHAESTGGDASHGPKEGED